MGGGPRRPDGKDQRLEMRIVSAAGIACLSACLGACSGGSPQTANVAAAGDSSPAAPVSEVNTTTGTSNVQQPVANANNAFQLVKGRRRPQTVVSSGSSVPLEFRPGPEDSEFATTMNDRGQPVEVRVFKGNSQLDRVEAVWLGPSEKLLRITLRNGSTVEVKTDRIANLASAPSALLVELAGGPK